MNEEKDKERILTALETKPLLTEELLEALGYEPGGGELVFPIRDLIEEGKIMREKVDTFRYRRCHVNVVRRKKEVKKGNETKTG